VDFNLGAFFAAAKNRAIRLYLFCRRQKRIPLLSLARAKAAGFRLSKTASVPFLSCKFFATQKTYKTISTGILPARRRRGKDSP
jgi:hypothetical protein